MAPLPSAEPILELINAFRRSKIMFTLVTSGIVDVLHAKGPCHAGDVAVALQTPSAGASEAKTFNPDAVDRLLRASVGLGLVQVQVMKQGGGVGERWRERRYGLTDVAKTYLVSGSRNSLAGYIWHSDRTLFPLWNALPVSLSTGAPAWEAAFPDLFMPSATSPSSTNPFSKLYGDASSRLRFQDAMHSHATLSARAIVDALPSPLVEAPDAVAVDLGGATGALAIELAARRTDEFREVLVVDLPAVVEVAKERYLVEERVAMAVQGIEKREGSNLVANVLEKVKPTVGDFLKNLDHFATSSSPGFPDATPATDSGAEALPIAHVYILSRILHDWDDATASALVRRVYANLKPGGAIVIAETLLDDDPSLGGPLKACLQDINMLVQTGGRERSENEYTTLLSRAGFVGVRSFRTGSYLDVVVAYKK
ncbi:hypothetical protein HDU96_000965 [Phlyctochytrium bullatum]|nr:hypothetical protein HDU96_000965 [Phlyctochytrium bullatum]